MGDFTVKKKLELMQQVRSRYQKDRYDMFHREKLLYGRTTPLRENAPYGSRSYDLNNMYEEENPSEISTFSIRLFVAAAAFALIVLSDRTGRSILGLSASRCFDAISTDYESSIAAWADSATGVFTTNTNETDDRPLKDNPPAGIRP